MRKPPKMMNESPKPTGGKRSARRRNAPRESALAHPRLVFPASLRPEPPFGYGKSATGNAVIQGENLATLHLLRATLEESVRCIYIDPPYNNQERYRHYHDAQSHDEWLAAIVKRLYALRALLSVDGSLWVSIDDREVHYLKVAADQVFGRENFITTIVWQQRRSRENRKVFSNDHEYILVYAKSAPVFRTRRNLLPPGEELLKRYRNPDKDPRGPWQSISANVQDGHATKAQYYEIVAPNGKRHRPPKGRCWIYNEGRMREEVAAGNVWFGRDGSGVPRLKKFLDPSRVGLTPHTLWTSQEVGTNNDAKKHLLQLFPGEPVFDTPKPESLIARVLRIATDPGDLVLDAYLGSGTTVAVAHKMDRRYIGIESGDHAVTHCASRLRMVIDGEGGGISQEIGWKGGGGFEFFRAEE